MAARKGRTTERPARANRSSLPFQIPFEMPSMNMDEAMDDFLEVDDADLEAELAALVGGKPSAPRQPATRTAAPAQRQPSVPVPPPRAARRGAAAAQANAGAFDPFDMSAIERIGMEEDDDEDVDEDDPELLEELRQLSPEVNDLPPTAPSFPKASPSSHADNNSAVLTLLKERLENYEGAHQEAVYQKETAKSNRYARTIKLLKEQISQAKQGKLVEEDQIPVPVFVKSVLQPSLSSDLQPPASRTPQPSPPPPPVRPTSASRLSVDTVDVAPSSASQPSLARTPVVSPPQQPTPNLPSPTTATSKNATVTALKARQQEYKEAALTAKKENEMDKAITFMKIYKQFNTVIEAAASGEAVDISAMPPHPSQLPADFLDDDDDEPSTPPPKSPAAAKPVAQNTQRPTSDDIPDVDPAEFAESFKAPEAPKTIMQALQQRLEKYKSTVEAAKAANDGAKVRRSERIVKQYQEAIRDFQAKRPVDFSELPTPPGFAPIPVSSGAAAPAGVPAVARAPTAVAPAHRPTQSPIKTMASGSNAIHGRESRQVQQHNFLMERQKQFKLAALKAKKEGALETAKFYLKQAMSMNQMVNASANGLPVDIASVPKAPPGMAGSDVEADHGYEVVAYEDAGADRPVNGPPRSRTEMYVQLEKDLVEQVAMCARNALHFKKAGDIPMTEKFQKFDQHSRKDLESLKNAFKHGLPVPRFHYETRAFSVVKCCPDLAENVMELSILRGFGYTLSGFEAHEIHTWVKWDFPFPAETPQAGKSMAIKGTNEPEYNAVFPIQINRKSRAMARVFKSKGIKCEVYAKMGFLKSDKVMGTVHINLESLETRCVYHTTLDLMDGKKAVGGKLEVRVRIREPLVKQQVEELREKLLVIDEFVR
ncbi:hypothetical protein RvY_17933 [Ramazzottius varieornatus]|uniref:DM14 domain-containing protein n=1 Tax=Ramazzottius varieornatus TaxID=947166 RepID=A0A1D1W4M4_RAMVA|nr:hypothetical protein RvY_17933 [Ramazzottius varieornatus]